MEVPMASPIMIDLYPSFCITLTTLGTLFSAGFFYYQVSGTKYSRSLLVELGLAAAASLLLGFGIFFLLLWTGLYL